MRDERSVRTDDVLDDNILLLTITAGPSCWHENTEILWPANTTQHQAGVDMDTIQLYIVDIVDTGHCIVHIGQ